MIVVGPEGGFSEKETAEADQAGAVSVGLGKRILRAETAGMAALTCVLYESEKWEECNYAIRGVLHLRLQS